MSEPQKDDAGDGGQSKTLLVAFARRIRRLRDDRAEITADIREVKKEAKTAGFDSTKIEEVVRWLEKVDKHGRDSMDEAEAIFDLYRSVIDGNAVRLDEMMNDARDRDLLKIFAPEDQVEKKLNKRQQTMRNALAMAQAAKEARQG